MRAAPAFHSGQRFPDLRLGRLFVVAQECGGGHEPAIDAVAALRHLLLDVGGLSGVQRPASVVIVPLPTADSGVTQERIG